MNTELKKQQVLEKLEKSWQALRDTPAGLTEAQMLTPGVTGDWSVKDILAHVNWWEEEALKYLPLILQGGRPPRYSVVYGGIDAFNAQMTELHRGLTLAEVLDRLDQTHGRLVELLQGVPEEQFTTDTPFRRRLRLDTYHHYAIHTQAICDWCEHSAEKNAQK